jgi:response regulator RpfG family c-di-GMP phosphodiesterase
MHEAVNNPAKVLFVDDEEHILKSLRRLLMDEDIEVLTAASGKEGLDLLDRTEGIEVIVSDQRMPGMSGAEFLQHARQKAPEALRIILTGYADVNATVDAINKGGACRYISKPWYDEELKQIIRDAVRQFRLIRENSRLSQLVIKQNEELKEWNTNLKNRVLEQTAAIRTSNDRLRELNWKLNKNFEDCLDAFSGLIELRDREMENHSRKVARLSVKIAEGMDLPGNDIEMIKVASLLHDIGKIGLPENLMLMNTDGMANDELEQYCRHAVLGQSAIDSIEDMRPAGMLIRHHHEHFDGSGFPDRLAGDDIPLGARIIALADSFDRIFASNRGDNAIEATLRTLKEESGKNFDPALLLHLGQPAGEIYLSLTAGTGMLEMELQAKDLREDMIISREVRSGSGLLLLGEGECLDAVKIKALRRYYHIDPPKKAIYVLAPSG